VKAPLEELVWVEQLLEALDAPSHDRLVEGKLVVMHLAVEVRQLNRERAGSHGERVPLTKEILGGMDLRQASEVLGSDAHNRRPPLSHDGEGSTFAERRLREVMACHELIRLRTEGGYADDWVEATSHALPTAEQLCQ
jgi:hypothetical protein